MSKRNTNQAESTERPDPTTYAGYRMHRKSRSTGTIIVRLNADAQGIENDHQPWALICEGRPGEERHAEARTFASEAEARRAMAAPEAWCSQCAKLVGKPTRNGQELAAEIAAELSDAADAQVVEIESLREAAAKSTSRTRGARRS